MRIATPGGHVTAELVGDPDAPRLVLQHGVGSSVRFLVEAVAPPLAAAGWCVVATDLRGHGDASPARAVEDHMLPLLAEDLAAVVVATGAVACGGVSLGAHAAASAVASGLAGVERLLCVLPAAVGQVDPHGPHAAVAAEVEHVGVSGMRERIAGEEGLAPWLREVLVRDLAASDDASVAAALRALPGAAAPTLEELLGLPRGVAVVGWPADPGHPLAVARAWAKAADHSTLITLDIADVDRDPLALGRAAATALGPP